MRRAGLTALRVLGCAWLLTTAARAQQGGVLLEEVLVTAEKKPIFLASDDASYVVGTRLSVDGGVVAR